MRARKQTDCSPKECLAIESELQRLLDKGVIIHSDPEPYEFISPIFVRPKSDGSYRLILNLKGLNKHIVYHHLSLSNQQSS